jgi:putative membrane protein
LDFSTLNQELRMILTRRIPLSQLLRFGLYLSSFGAGWAAIVYALYTYLGWTFLRLPFLPIATIGTAVAFYIGFKNNAAYERFWEGRKIWGGVVNSSRTWATFVVSYIHPGDTSEEAHTKRQELIYRHLAWINALRLQLRKTSRFYNKPARATRLRLEKHADHMRNDWDKEIAPFLAEEEFQNVTAMANSATHLLTKQGTELSDLVRGKKLDLFHQIAMMEVVEEFYTLQGKCERIKNTPFPRLYAEYSRWFTRVFVMLVPFGLLDVFARHTSSLGFTWSSLLFAVPMVLSAALITWVFLSMESIGDASEDPFERSMNDVPMNALCRTIEIDLRQMLGETDLPEKESSIDNLLY